MQPQFSYTKRFNESYHSVSSTGSQPRLHIRNFWELKTKQNETNNAKAPSLINQIRLPRNRTRTSAFLKFPCDSNIQL